MGFGVRMRIGMAYALLTRCVLLLWVAVAVIVFFFGGGVNSVFKLFLSSQTEKNQE